MSKFSLNDYEINILHRMFNRMLASVEKMNTKQQKNKIEHILFIRRSRERLHHVRVSVLRYNDMCLKDKYFRGTNFVIIVLV